MILLIRIISASIWMAHISAVCACEPTSAAEYEVWIAMTPNERTAAVQMVATIDPNVAVIPFRIPQNEFLLTDLSVTVAGASTPFKLGMQELIIELTPTDQPVNVEISYLLTATSWSSDSDGILSSGGNDDWFVLGDWLFLVPPLGTLRHPRPERRIPPFGDDAYLSPAQFTVHATTGTNWTVAAAGEKIRTTTPKNGRHTITFNGTGLRDFTLVACRTCEQRTSTVGTTTLRTTGPSLGVERRHRNGVKLLEAMTQRYGPLSQPELDIVLVPGRPNFGVEFSGLAMVGDSGNAPSGVEPLILAHEIAHQWFFHEVGSDQLTEPWVDESMSSLAEILAVPLFFGPEAQREVSQHFIDYMNAGSSGTRPDLSIYAYPRDAYYYDVYGAPASALWDRYLTNPSAFDAAVRSYIESNRCSFATSSDVRTLLNTPLPSLEQAP